MLSHSSAMMSSAHGYSVIDDHARNLLNDTERGGAFPHLVGYYLPLELLCLVAKRLDYPVIGESLALELKYQALRRDNKWMQFEVSSFDDRRGLADLLATNI